MGSNHAAIIFHFLQNPTQKCYQNKIIFFFQKKKNTVFIKEKNVRKKGVNLDFGMVKKKGVIWFRKLLLKIKEKNK